MKLCIKTFYQHKLTKHIWFQINFDMAFINTNNLWHEMTKHIGIQIDIVRHTSAISRTSFAGFSCVRGPAVDIGEERSRHHSFLYLRPGSDLPLEAWNPLWPFFFSLSLWPLARPITKPTVRPVSLSPLPSSNWNKPLASDAIPF